MADISIFSKRLRVEREKLGLKQKEMAEKLNMPSNTYNGYETGKRIPALDVAKNIADALDVTTDYLLGRTDNRKLNTKDERSIQKDLKDIINDFKTGQAGPAFFNGQELSEKDLEVLEVGMEAILTTLKIQNKEKYTPNKYKNE